jgi:periplasmic protein TonB
MKRKNENVPGFDEIIFENRNKEYGAYDLRKRYLNTTFFSLLGGVVLSVSLVLSISFSMSGKVTGKPVEKGMIIVRIDPTILEPEQPKPEAAIPKPQAFKPVYTEPEIVEKLDSNDIVLSAVTALDSVKNRPVDAIVVQVENPDPVIPVEREPEVWVEEMPAFPGGNEALLKYISKTIQYPQTAVENGIQGKVTLRFVVSSDGSVKRVEVLRGVDPLLNEEAVRVVSSLPKWKPGKQNGKPVPVWFSVPVTFKLEDR